MAHKKVFEEPPNKDVPKESLGSKLLTWFHGWKLYMTHPVRNAGLGLACLYMTVLGFDNVTYGYCLQQCVSESVLGASVGASCIVGVCASMLFPFFRKCIGLAKTGIVGMTTLVATLSLCLASIFLKGSPFDPYYFHHQKHVSFKQ